MLVTDLLSFTKVKHALGYTVKLGRLTRNNYAYIGATRLYVVSLTAKPFELIECVRECARGCEFALYQAVLKVVSSYI